MENQTDRPPLTEVERIQQANREWYLTSTPLLVLLSAIVIYGFLGNLLILITYGKKREKQSSHLLMINLAVADLLICTVSDPFFIILNIDKYSFTSNEACKTLSMITSLLLSASVILHTSISIDRCISIRKRSRTNSEYRIAVLSCIVAWSLSVLIMLASGVIFGTASVHLPQYNATGVTCNISPMTSDTQGQAMFFIILLVLFVICFTITCICYCLIGKVAYRQRKLKMLRSRSFTVSYIDVKPLEDIPVDKKKRSTRMLTRQATQISQLTQRSSQISDTEDKQKTFKMLFAITISFIACWIPFWVISIKNSLSPSAEREISFSLAVFEEFMKRLFLLNSANNPIIFTFVSETFRREATIWMKKMCCCKTNITPMPSEAMFG